MIPVGPLPPPVTPLSRERGPGEKLLALACSYPALWCSLYHWQSFLCSYPLSLGDAVPPRYFSFQIKARPYLEHGGCRELLGAAGAAGGCRGLLELVHLGLHLQIH